VFFIPYTDTKKEFKDRVKIVNAVFDLAFEELEPKETKKLKELKLAKDEIKELHDEMKKKQKDFDKKLEDQKGEMQSIFDQTKRDYDLRIQSLTDTAEQTRKELLARLQTLTEAKNYHGSKAHGSHKKWHFWVYPQGVGLANTAWDTHDPGNLCDHFRHISNNEYECLGHSPLYHGDRNRNFDIYVYPSNHPLVNANCWDTDNISKICSNATYHRDNGNGAHAYRCNGHKGQNTGYDQ